MSALAAGDSQASVGRFHEAEIAIIDDYLDAHVPAEPYSQFDYGPGMFFMPWRVVDEHHVGTDAPQFVNDLAQAVADHPQVFERPVERQYDRDANRAGNPGPVRPCFRAGNNHCEERRSLSGPCGLCDGGLPRS